MGWDFFDGNGNFVGSMQESSSGSNGGPGCLGIIVGLILTFVLYWLGHKYGNAYWSFAGVAVGLLITFTMMNYLGLFGAGLILLGMICGATFIVMWICSLLFPPICVLIAGIVTFVGCIWGFIYNIRN